MKQLTLIPKPKSEHGGMLNYKKRKTYRPLHTKKVIHLILKSHKSISLYENKEFVTQTIQRQADLSGVKIYGLTVQHDHIHHALYFFNRQNYHRFVRSVTSLLSRKFGCGMWKFSPYTRVVEWGRDFNNLKSYLNQNELEVTKKIPYQPRRKRSLNEKHENMHSDN